ncbi:MAG: hypothetical protein P8N57_02720 [Flavobacteriaceae bacterium]|nr:hypothetical protein [Flavobacteriaceae bacterium]
MMTSIEFSNLSKKFDALSEEQRISLEKITYRYPYFQAAYALYLKTLKEQDKYNFDLILKKTSVISPDRSKLYKLIYGHPIVNKSQEKLSVESVSNSQDQVEDVIETIELIEETNAESETIEKTTIINDKSEIPTNLSFLEWLEWSKSNSVGDYDNISSKSSFEDKIDLIDAFLKNNPKIPPVSTNVPKQNLSKKTKFNKEELMTETLAKVYVKQQKFKKALLAYKILSLKYPEKNSFFADQIKAIKELQKK